MYFKDESLLSFLFRTQLLYSGIDFSNLFTFGGRIRSHLKAKKELLPLYQRFNEGLLYSILNDYEHEQTSFSHPYNDLKMVKEFLNLGFCHVYQNSCESFTYCDMCIEESYHHHGVGYLQRQWGKTKYCDVHKKSLSVLPPLSYKNSVDSMFEILSGNLPHPKKIYTYSMNEALLTRGMGKIIRPFSSIYIKPCALLLLQKWIYCNKNYLLTVLPKKIGDPYSIDLLRELSKHPETYVKQIFKKRNEDNLQAFNDFISENTVITTEKYGVIYKDSFKFKIMKARNIKCKFSMNKKLCYGCEMWQKSSK
ncbi:TPA: hypothetical protein MHS11_001468 [Klebsiella aerogenes]|nr:hypothetical protein [Klebsiella aerogenes]HDR2592123.1 hypothetical protein [Enterobacter bugandensis]